MVPQLLLGGLLRPPAQAGEPSAIRRACEFVTVQRWGFEAAIATDVYCSSNIVSVGFGSWDLTARYAELNLLRPEERGLLPLFFKPTHLDRQCPASIPPMTWTVITRIAVLLVFALASLAGTWLAVRVRFR